MASFAVEAVADPVDAWRRLSDAAVAVRLRSDQDIPWWAIELLDLPPGSDLSRVRSITRYGRPRFAGVWNLFAELVERAERTVMQRSLEEWRELCRSDTAADGTVGDVGRIIRDAALFNPRAFCALCDIRDEEQIAIVPKDFHLQMLVAMRMTRRPAMIQAFWGSAKSWNSSILVPLLDWAEWPGATEGRIYLDEDQSRKWTGKLMQTVEENDALHALFPWIDKPTRGDTGFKIWGFDGFAIKGNPVKVRSFEGHTIGSSKTGFRYSGRVGIDDVVSDKEAHTPSIQERNLRYIKALVVSMRQRLRSSRRERSRYGTVFPGMFTIGTPYDQADVNVQLEREYREKGWKTLRVPIFVGEDKRPRWPELCSPAYLAELREEMGPRAFRLRCELKVGGVEHSIFPEELVDIALKDGRSDPFTFTWCVVPEHTKLIIGFDPGSGRRPTHHGARYPAFAVYGVRDLSWWMPQHPSTTSLFRDGGLVPPPPDLCHHVVQWGRLEGLGFHSQCQRLADLARVYNCPVAVEDNGVQQAYADQISAIAPDVSVICHTTGDNKRDPVQGVEQFEPILRNERLVIHAQDAPGDMVRALRDELIQWPGPFTDLVMALWIARHQYALHVSVSQPLRVSPQAPLPSYVQRFVTGIPDRFAGRSYGR